MEKRRDFLKKSIFGLSGAALLNTSSFQLRRTGEAPELPSRTLGKTGLKIPLISMGTAGASSAGLIRNAYESGIRLFFSATYYGEGNNERLAGEALGKLPRESFVMGTAVPANELDPRTGRFVRPFDVKAYLKKTDESLSRLGMDHADILLFPYAGKKETILDEGVLRAMEELKKQGKTKYTGIASHSDVAEALDAAAASKQFDVAMIAYNFKSLDADKLNAAIENASKAGMGIVAMKTTAGAFDTRSGPPLNTDAAFKWVLKNKNISSIVSAMSSVEEMTRNLKMINDLKMTEQEMKDLRLASGGALGLYCHQCGRCLGQCSAGLDIPSIMRSYMYAYGYRNIAQAKYTLSNTGIENKACSSCSSCRVTCSAGFDVKLKITDIARLTEVPDDFITG